MNQVMVLLLVSISLLTSIYAKPTTPPKSPQLDMSIDESSFACSVVGDKDVKHHVRTMIAGGRLKTKRLCRVVNDYFIQLGCPNGDVMTGESLKEQNEPSPHFMQAGALLVPLNGKNELTASLVIALRPVPWLAGSHRFVGYCNSLDVLRKLSQEPTLIGNIPRRSKYLTRAVLSDEQH